MRVRKYGIRIVFTNFAKALPGRQAYMTEQEKTIRLSKVKGEFNVSITRIFEYLEERGHKLDRNPNGKITEEQYKLLLKEFAQDREEKEESKQVGINTRTKKESIVLEDAPVTKA